MKGQNSGFDNEKNIAVALNQKKYSELKPPLNEFVKEVFPKVKEEDEVGAWRYREKHQLPSKRQVKPDVEIEVNGEYYGVSVKTGSSNSVHQEPMDSFINYCTTVLDMTSEERDSLLKAFYGDGTTDGNSEIKDRLTLSEIKKEYSQEIKCAQGFLDRNKFSLIERFLIYGRWGRELGYAADYIYHGDTSTGIWCKLDTANIFKISQMSHKPGSTSTWTIGPLSLQVYSRGSEKKRHDIQSKWTNCQECLNILHEEDLKRITSDKNYLTTINAQFQNRRVGDNHHGFDNEYAIVEALNNHKISSLPSYLKNMVHSMFPYADDDKIVSAVRIKKNEIKPNIYVKYEGVIRSVSVFTGTCNSAHQEPLNEFLKYCKETLGMPQELCDSYRKIHYGDGTLDGSENDFSKRMDVPAIKDTYIDEIKAVQSFLDNHREELARRFLIYGKKGVEYNISSDYILYGNDREGIAVPYEEVINYIKKCSTKSSALLSVGPLNIQIWKRDLCGKDKTLRGRHSIQVKFQNIPKVLKEIQKNINVRNGTEAGTLTEYNFVSYLNRNKSRNNKAWSVFSTILPADESLDKIYAVRVTSMVESKLSKRKVYPKADAYLVKADIRPEMLTLNNYWLDENVLEDENYKFIENSGISCKIEDSKSFTYLKLTISSFLELFGEENKYIGCGICLFVTPSDLELNKNILQAWNLNEKMFRDYWMNFFGSECDFSDKDEELKFYQKIKKTAIKKLHDIILSDKSICDKIFKGTDLYPEPYTAHFIYVNGALQENDITPDFNITTGSGRHKGTYTIVIKPKESKTKKINNTYL